MTDRLIGYAAVAVGWLAICGAITCWYVSGWRRGSRTGCAWFDWLGLYRAGMTGRLIMGAGFVAVAVAIIGQAYPLIR